jgi:hypothetical protein
MDEARARRLAEKLESLRLALLATETYLTQLRALVAEAQQDLTDLAVPGTPPAKQRRRPVRR